MLQFIGTGNYSNFKKGSNVAFTRYSTERTTELDGLFLIDAGEGVTERLVDLEAFSGVKEVTILLTHMHSDHVAGLPGLVTYIKHFVKGRVPVKIYYPHPNDIEKLLLLMLISTSDYNITVEAPKYLNNPNIRNLEVYEAMHGSYKNCYSYKFTLQFGAESEKVYYSGDSILTPKTVKMLKDKEVDKVYHDIDINYRVSSDYPHATLSRILQTIPVEYRDKIYAMHLSQGENVESCIRMYGLHACQPVKDANEMKAFVKVLTQFCLTGDRKHIIKEFVRNREKEISSAFKEMFEQDACTLSGLNGNKIFMHYYADPSEVSIGKILNLGTFDFSYWSRNPADTNTVYTEPNIREDKYLDRVLITVEYMIGIDDKIPFILDHENDRIIMKHTKFGVIRKVEFSDAKIPIINLQVSPNYDVLQ